MKRSSAASAAGSAQRGIGAESRKCFGKMAAAAAAAAAMAEKRNQSAANRDSK
jgi:hypothetical protein